MTTPPPEPAPDAAEDASDFEARLLPWLRDVAGIPDARRLVSLDEETAVVSKTPPGLAPRLHALLDQLPEILDLEHAGDAYRAECEVAEPSAGRVEVWSRALRRLLHDLGDRRGVEDVEAAQIRIGIDSVRAVMESVLWTGPLVADAAYEPHRAERAAYLDATRRMAGHDLFTRHYGDFDGRAVLNHCPGAAHARVLLEQAWRICTGTPPPDAPPDRYAAG